MEKRKLSKEQLDLLKKALPKEAIKPHPTKAYLSTIKAIYVVERLNDVFGIAGWKMRNEVIIKEGKWVVVKSIFTASEYEIEVENFGGNDNVDLGDAYKGACTDALTKIASYLGIGMDVYKGLTEPPKTPTTPTTTTPTKQTSAKTTLVKNSQDYYTVLETLQTGKCTIDYVKSKFELTKELETELNNINK